MPEKRDSSLTTSSGKSLKGEYTRDDLSDWNPSESLGRAGDPPFTRGNHASGYRGRLWTMRQYAGYATAAASNRRYRYLLEQGQSGLSVAFDLPTQIGYDSDHAMARGEVGRVGVAIDSLDDMETLFDGIPLDSVSTSMTINATASILLALYVAVGRRQGVADEKLSGTVQNDILKEYMARGTYIYPPGPSMRIATDVIAFCLDTLPRFNPISISGYHIREAGATAAQELAFTLANGLAYVDAAVSAGLDVDEFGARLSFFFNSHRNFLEEIAKYRAARRLWGKLLRERYRSKNPRAQMLRFHTQTAGSTLTAQQPEVNVIRTTLQALAAVLGGTQSLHCNALDEALGLPTEETAELALRTQQVIAYESGVPGTIDPFGGSYAMESMTDAIEHEAESILAELDRRGGALEAIEAGWPQGEIREAAYRFQKGMESGEHLVVGVNVFEKEERVPVEVFSVDATVETDQVARLEAVRARRSASAATQALDDVERAAKTDANLMPPILGAVSAYVTVGEISDRLRKVFGEYRSS
ncbi:MAG: methylmalonyl-CoA mutase family protein [Acidobacteriota bacterium]|nr:MAG: methylmalonyl-CoA mutase family protein [Acidobacteriota bacterium]